MLGSLASIDHGRGGVCGESMDTDAARHLLEVPPLSPPSYGNICRFIAEYAGRLPLHHLTGTAPYEYTGCDYALILYSMMPSNCIDLSRLCWSISPLPAQLEGNLAAFCEGARCLGLCDTPLSSITPNNLRAVPTCFVHHLRVQHWLYVMSLRFPPDEKFDAPAIRMRLRHAQLGQPYLTPREAIETLHMDSAALSHAPLALPAGLKVMQGTGESVQNPCPLHCQSVWSSASVNAEPLSTSSTAVTSVARAESDALEAREKPRKDYGRPWRTPTLKAPTGPGTAVATQISSRTADVRSGTLTYGSSLGSALPAATFVNLAKQWCESESRRLHLKATLSRARDSAQSSLLSVGAIEFDKIISILQQRFP
ncbi:hypothetical protein TRVL_06566 [Trypanosoma vivax]|nr:hypothetical protein TRVL_06566 [Trypanosoma vivax]